jgi:hypothetical protein
MTAPQTICIQAVMKIETNRLQTPTKPTLNGKIKGA